MLSAIVVPYVPGTRQAWRDGMTARLSDQFPGAPICLHAQGNWSKYEQFWRGLVASLEAVPPRPGSWRLWVEDDAYVPPTFADAATQAVAACSATAGGGRVGVCSFYASDRGVKDGLVPWVVFNTVCQAIRDEMVADLAGFQREWFAQPQSYGWGYAASRFLREHRMTARRTGASLVQHRSGESLFWPGKERTRHSKSFVRVYGDVPND